MVRQYGLTSKQFKDVIRATNTEVARKCGIIINPRLVFEPPKRFPDAEGWKALVTARFYFAAAEMAKEAGWRKRMGEAGKEVVKSLLSNKDFAGAEEKAERYGVDIREVVKEFILSHLFDDKRDEAFDKELCKKYRVDWKEFKEHVEEITCLKVIETRKVLAATRNSRKK